MDDSKNSEKIQTDSLKNFKTFDPSWTLVGDEHPLVWRVVYRQSRPGRGEIYTGGVHGEATVTTITFLKMRKNLMEPLLIDMLDFNIQLLLLFCKLAVLYAQRLTVLVSASMCIIPNSTLRYKGQTLKARHCVKLARGEAYTIFLDPRSKVRVSQSIFGFSKKILAEKPELCFDARPDICGTSAASVAGQEGGHRKQQIHILTRIAAACTPSTRLQCRLMFILFSAHILAFKLQRTKQIVNEWSEKLESLRTRTNYLYGSIWEDGVECSSLESRFSLFVVRVRRSSVAYLLTDLSPCSGRARHLSHSREEGENLHSVEKNFIKKLLRPEGSGLVKNCIQNHAVNDLKSTKFFVRYPCSPKVMCIHNPLIEERVSRSEWQVWQTRAASLHAPHIRENCDFGTRENNLTLLFEIYKRYDNSDSVNRFLVKIRIVFNLDGWANGDSGAEADENASTTLKKASLVPLMQNLNKFVLRRSHKDTRTSTLRWSRMKLAACTKKLDCIIHFLPRKKTTKKHVIFEALDESLPLNEELQHKLKIEEIFGFKRDISTVIFGFGSSCSTQRTQFISINRRLRKWKSYLESARVQLYIFIRDISITEMEGILERFFDALGEIRILVTHVYIFNTYETSDGKRRLRRYGPLYDKTNMRYDLVKLTMSKARRESVPSTPSTLTQLGDTLLEYHPLQNFYKGQAEGKDKSVALIFINDSFLKPLASVSQLFCDGTFNIRLRRRTLQQKVDDDDKVEETEEDDEENPIDIEFLKQNLKTVSTAVNDDELMPEATQKTLTQSKSRSKKKTPQMQALEDQQDMVTDIQSDQGNENRPNSLPEAGKRRRGRPRKNTSAQAPELQRDNQSNLPSAAATRRRGRPRKRKEAPASIENLSEEFHEQANDDQNMGNIDMFPSAHQILQKNSNPDKDAASTTLSTEVCRKDSEFITEKATIGLDNVVQLLENRPIIANCSESTIRTTYTDSSTSLVTCSSKEKKKRRRLPRKRCEIQTCRARFRVRRLDCRHRFCVPCIRSLKKRRCPKCSTPIGNYLPPNQMGGENWENEMETEEPLFNAI
ncbi:unnamed protein product, partial [Trichogramma brassicae]